MSIKLIKAIIPLTDQGLVSGSNFFITVILARYLSLNDFGVFSTIWIACISASALLQAIIYTPLFSMQAKFEERKKIAFRNITFIELLLIYLVSFLFILLLYLFLNSFGNLDVFEQIFSSFYFSLAYCLFDYVRKRLIAEVKNKAVLFFDLIIYCGLIFSVMIPHSITLDFVIESFTLVYFIVSLLAVFMFKLINLRSISSLSFREIMSIVSQQWHYSKWLIASSGFQFISGNAVVLVSGYLLTVSVISYVRMVQNIIGMLNPIYSFLDNHAQIYLSNVKARSGEIKYINTYRLIYISVIVVLLSLLIFIFVYSNNLLNIIYEIESEYATGLLRLMVVVSIFNTLNFLERLKLKVELKSKTIFNSYLISSTITLIIIYPIVINFSGYGVMFVLMMTQVAMLVVMILPNISKKENLKCLLKSKTEEKEYL